MPIAGGEGDDVELGLETAAELAQGFHHAEKTFASDVDAVRRRFHSFALAAGCRAPDVEFANHGREHAAFADGLDFIHESARTAWRSCRQARGG